MTGSVTPVLHVRDVSSTATWYETIGFTLVSWHACDADTVSTGTPPSTVELDWALLRWGDDEIMLNAGGAPRDAVRRDADLYINLDPASPDQGVDAMYARWADIVQVVEPPYDAFHGNRELILRDPDGFWITFAQPVSQKDPGD